MALASRTCLLCLTREASPRTPSCCFRNRYKPQFQIFSRLALLIWSSRKLERYVALYDDPERAAKAAAFEAEAEEEYLPSDVDEALREDWEKHLRKTRQGAEYWDQLLRIAHEEERHAPSENAGAKSAPPRQQRHVDLALDEAADGEVSYAPREGNM